MGDPASPNVFRTDGHVTAADRRALLGHGPATVWFTGLSGSGKSTLAYALERALVDRGVAAFVLDGDNVRHGLNRDLGFSPSDREENIRRIGEVCRLMHDAGLVVLSSFISPYRRDRQLVRDLYPPGGFLEVHVSTPIDVCEQRDVKGLYARARAGEITQFSGVSAPYEAPEAPDLAIDTSEVTVDEAVDVLAGLLAERGVLG
jgi:adenylyl-sulfate kinase